MKNNLKIGLLIFGIIVPLFLVINHFTILTRIYYNVNYDTNIQNFDDIVEKRLMLKPIFDNLHPFKYVLRKIFLQIVEDYVCCL